jgi:hypothetical protein
MARPPLALGHHGTIKVTRDGGQWIARCPVRDLDGVTRRVARWASSRTAAQKALQDELGQRRGERIELLRPQSTFRDAATVWAAKIAERREDSTADTYRHWLDGLVLPQLAELRLHECDVARIDTFFSRLERARRTIKHDDGTTTEKIRYAANTRRTIRAIVASVMQQAVLHQAVVSNPVRELERIESPKEWPAASAAASSASPASCSVSHCLPAQRAAPGSRRPTPNPTRTRPDAVVTVCNGG